MSFSKLRLAVLISGGGTTAQAICKAIETGELEGIEIPLAICSNPNADGIDRLINSGVAQNVIILSKEDKDPEEYGQSMLDLFNQYGIDLFGQYGWMVKTPGNVVEAFQGRGINQHPAPLDPGNHDFGGKGMYGRRAIAATMLYMHKHRQNNMFTEATAHFVTSEYDKGEIIHKIRISIDIVDDVLAVQKKLLPVEHQCQIAALRAYLQDGQNAILKRGDKLIKTSEEYMALQKYKEIAGEMFPGG